MVSDFDKILSAYRLDYFEQIDTNLSKIDQVLWSYDLLKTGDFCDHSSITAIKNTYDDLLASLVALVLKVKFQISPNDKLR